MVDPLDVICLTADVVRAIPWLICVACGVEAWMHAQAA